MEQKATDINEIRLQKYLADSGIASRRKCEEYILQGKVSVNGKVITKLGTKVNPKKDEILFENKKIEKENKKYYILLNKPIGYVTTAKDQFERDTVLDLVKEVPARLVPVGRLDMYTSGALLLSNDGDFVYQITHPKHEIDKVYNATITGTLSKEDKKQLEQGVKIEAYTTRPAIVKILKVDDKKNITRVQVTIHEGKNRQVRKMFEAVGKKVIALHRCQIGPIKVNNLKLGTWRHLSKNELDLLK